MQFWHSAKRTDCDTGEQCFNPGALYASDSFFLGSRAITVLIANQPALNDTSTLTCSYGVVIAVKSAGQTTVHIP